MKRLKDLDKESERLRKTVSDLTLEKLILREVLGKLRRPVRRRACVDYVRQKSEVSERFACRVLGQYRWTQRKVPHGRADEDALTADFIALASQYGR